MRTWTTSWISLRPWSRRTPTHAENAPGIARCHALLAPHIEALGFDVERVTSSAAHPHDASRTLTRDHLVATFRAPAHGGASGRPTVLLMGHLDTVFPIDHAFQRLTRNGNEWRGPGVSDMKGGIVTALLTLALLRDAGRLGDANWRLVLASDEEQGSPTALSVLTRAARGADLALCFEAARPCGGVVVARKGYASARLLVEGISGHAGIAHDTAVNALSVLARIIVDAEALEGRYAGLSVSPGGNVLVSPAQVTSIPDRAACEVEWRFTHDADGEAVLGDLRGIALREERESRARVHVDGGVECGPMASTPRSERVLAHYVDAARALGMVVRGVTTAGVGDINLVSRMGATCLDGVGPEGGSFHTEREFLLVDSIARRAAMNVAAIGACLTDLRAT